MTESFAQPITSPTVTPNGVAEMGATSAVTPGMGMLPDAGQAYMQGGSVQPVNKRSNSFFDGITILDIGMISLAALAIFMSIYYTRQQINWLKANKSQIRNDIDELRANVKSILGDEYKP